MEKIHEIYLRTTPERLWQALASEEDRPHFPVGKGIRSDWTVGSLVEISNPRRLYA